VAHITRPWVAPLRAAIDTVSPLDQPGLNALLMSLGENTMMYKQHGMLYLLLVISLISLLAGCVNNLTNSQFTVRVSGSTVGLQFDGQCTAQKAGFLPGDSVAQSLDVKGTVGLH